LALFLKIKEGSPEAIHHIENNLHWRKMIFSDVREKQTKWTLLHVASWYGHSELCKEMILMGADVNAKDAVRNRKHNETPLHLAVFRGHVNTVRVLAKFPLERNQMNVVRDKQKGETPMDLAKELNNQEIISAVEECNLRSQTLRSATLKIVDI
jgi:ankyrin repeat protein